jgi:hypothetical protein
MARKVVELYDRFDIKYVAIKGDIDTSELIHKINEIVSMKGDVKAMNWETIVTTVVSAIAPYATIFGTSAASAVGTKFGEAVSENVQRLWEWIRQSIEGRGNAQDKQILEDFKLNPSKYQDALVQTVLRLAPQEDAVLRQYTQDLIQELFRLLDNYDNFTIVDLKRICSRVSVHWENEVPNPTSEALSRWVSGYARTRHKEKELVAAMLEINPNALPR